MSSQRRGRVSGINKADFCRLHWRPWNNCHRPLSLNHGQIIASGYGYCRTSCFSFTVRSLLSAQHVKRSLNQEEVSQVGGETQFMIMLPKRLIWASWCAALFLLLSAQQDSHTDRPCWFDISLQKRRRVSVSLNASCAVKWLSLLVAAENYIKQQTCAVRFVLLLTPLFF